MAKKTPGKLAPPPTQANFDRIPLDGLCMVHPPDVFLRLHSLNPKTRKPWPPIYFSDRGTSRFDHNQGPGTLYAGTSLAGVLMEVFDDAWGHLGDPRRSLSEQMFSQWFLSEIPAPELLLFDATGSALSKMGTDLQLLTGPYDVTQEWGLRIASHPAQIDGILYPSRHDASRRNIAIFRRNWMRRQLQAERTRCLNDVRNEVEAACVELGVAITP